MNDAVALAKVLFPLLLLFLPFDLLLYWPSPILFSLSLSLFLSLSLSLSRCLRVGEGVGGCMGGTLYLVLSCLISSHLISSGRIQCYLISSCLSLSYAISSHLILSISLLLCPAFLFSPLSYDRPHQGAMFFLSLLSCLVADSTSTVNYAHSTSTVNYGTVNCQLSGPLLLLTTTN